MLWKRLNTETSQQGNASKKSGNPSKTGFFFRRFRNFCNPVFEGFPLYFEAFPKIFEGIPLFTYYFWGISQYFWGISQYFWGISPKFLRRFRILKTWFSWSASSFSWGVSAKYEAFPYFLKLDLVEVFPLFLRRFHFFEAFPFFEKSF